MKKSIIAAGAASAVLAAMPVLGVFATSTPVTSHVDKLSLTLNPVCTLGTVTNGEAVEATDATTHANGTGTWTNGTGANAATGSTGRTDTLAATLVNSQTYSNLGTTTFTIRCTNNAGYELKAVSGTATGGKATLVSGSNVISAGTSTSWTGEPETEGGPATYDPSTDASYWNFKLSNATGNITIAAGGEGDNAYNYANESVVPITTATIVASSSAAGNLNAGESVTVTYGAGINNAQPAGTYEGTVTYTLVQK